MTKRALFQAYSGPFLGEGLRLIRVSNFEEGKRTLHGGGLCSVPVEGDEQIQAYFSQRVGGIARALEGVAEAELELPFRGVGIALSVDPSEGTARRAYVRVVIVGVVGEIEGLSSEDQLMVFMVWNDLEALLERGAKAFEAGAIDQASRSTRSESSWQR